MLIIGCLSQKGGVGKSTMARLIARQFAVGDWRVKIADFDTAQTTSTKWVSRRLTQNVEPAIAAEPLSVIKTAVDLQGYDLLVIDGKPHSDRQTLEIARICNLVVIPSGTGLDDLEPSVLLAHEMVRNGIPRDRIIFVLNQATDSELEVADARDYLSRPGYRVAQSYLSARQAYKLAQSQGRTVSETTHKSLNERADQLVQEIVDMVISPQPAAVEAS